MYTKSITLTEIDRRRRNQLSAVTESVATDPKTKAIDRILKNHTTILESGFCQFDIVKGRRIDDMLNMITETVDKFNMQEHKKFIVSIMEASYLFDKNYIQYDSSDIINTLTDYYLIKNESSKDLASIKENMVTSLFNLLEEFDSSNDYNVYLLESEDFADSEDIKKLLDRYKKDTEKSDSKLKQIIIKMYSKSPSQIIDDTPHVLSLVRNFAIIGGLAINPFLGLVTFMVDKWVGMTVSREQTERMYSVFKKEQEKINDKAMWADEDTKKGKELQSYNSCIDKCMDKLSEYKDTLYSERELDHIRGLDESANDPKNCVYYQDLLDIYDTQIVPVYINTINGLRQYLEDNHIDTSAIISANSTSYMNAILAISDKESLSDFMDKFNMLTLDLLEVGGDVERVRLINKLSTKYLADNDTTPFTPISTFSYHYDETDRLRNQSMSTYLTIPCKITFDTIEEDETLSDSSMGNSELDEAAFILATESLLSSIQDKGLYNLTEYVEEKVNDIEDYMAISSLLSEAGSIVDTEKISSKLLSIKRESADSIKRMELACAIGILKDNTPTLNNPLAQLWVSHEAADIVNKYIHEEFNTASLKVAAINLTNKAKELSSKEKQMSSNMDIAMEGFRRNIEKALTTNKRESIIKGSIIPSFSKCIKLALITGGAFMVNPVLAVIGTVGSFALSRKLTKNERQLLLDEIEVQGKAIEKEISLAESDGDMKKYKQLLMYQKRLQREEQRIRFNIKSTGETRIDTEGDE